MFIKRVVEFGNELAVQQLQSVQANNLLLHSKNLFVYATSHLIDLRCESVT